MDEQAERNEKGQFALGHKGIGGRPSKAREAALLAIGQEIVNAQVWRNIVNKAVFDALGKTVVGGQAIDDSDSTAGGRNTARTWIRDTFIGRPAEYIKSDDGDSAYSQLDTYSTEELAVILKRIERESETLGRESSGDGVSAAGVGAPPEGETPAG